MIQKKKFVPRKKKEPEVHDQPEGVYDYMCKVKCVFEKRMHYPETIYAFSSDLKPPKGFFTLLGVHKEKVSLEAQVTALTAEVERLTEILKAKEVTNEKTD